MSLDEKMREVWQGELLLVVHAYMEQSKMLFGCEDDEVRRVLENNRQIAIDRMFGLCAKLRSNSAPMKRIAESIEL